MKEYGPQEVGYVCLWNPEDIEIVRGYVRKEAELLKVEDQTMHLEFINQIERALNDHKDAGISINNKKAEILAASKGLDIPTIQGLNFAARGVITVASRFRYMGAGDDPREARAYHQKLF